MAKLNVKVDAVFCTDSVSSTHPDGGRGEVDVVTRDSLLAEIPKSEYGFLVTSVNEDAIYEFEIYAKNGKKGSSIEIEKIDDGNGLKVVLRGDFSVTIKAPVARRLSNIVDELDLRIAGAITENYYSGVGLRSDAFNENDFPGSLKALKKVDSYTIK